METKGTLALAGSGEYLPEMEPVDRQLLERVGGAPRVVCLPTAAGSEGAQTVARWSRMGVEHFRRLGAQVEPVEVIDRKTADDETLAGRIRAANFVYLSGGKPDYLYQSLVDTRAWQAIVGVLANGGVVAGCSAGAMIFGAHLPTFPTLWPLRPAFNYLPGSVIVPHYDEVGEPIRGILKLLVGRLAILGIEGYTALVKSEGTLTALGAKGVTVWNQTHQRRYLNGETVDWA